MPGRVSWQDQRLEIAEREMLLIYTDGVTDTRGDGGRFGDERLHQLLRTRAGSSPTVLLSALDGALAAFRLGPQADDTAAVALARAPVEAALTRSPANARPHTA
jgi:serine phosphatase RsbU (regulator of sigma subunit)